MDDSFDAAVVIGRFQPFHDGHLALVRAALAVAPKVFIVLGSARAARSPRNPWTDSERGRMIRGALSAEDQARVELVPLRDYFDEPRWRRALVSAIEARTGENARIAVVGHFKDTTSTYLRGFEQWGLVRVPLQGDIHATKLREAYFLAPGAPGAEPSEQEPWSAVVPPSTRRWLREFASSPAYTELAEELRALQAYARAWQSAPYPPVFVTVDAVVTCREHVLLIQRGRAPGKGLWAVPGGFLELAETLLQSARRELREETGLELPLSGEVPVRAHVFDHPQRSQRGRTISHAFQFELESPGLPELLASDDAARLAWVPIAELVQREPEFFDDHFHMLDTFLGLLPRE